MSLDSIIHLITAMLYGALAWLLWWQAMPSVIAARGRLQGMGPWCMGMAMACFVSGRLDMAFDGAPVRWTFTAGDVFLMGAAVLWLSRSRQLGGHRWNRHVAR